MPWVRFPVSEFYFFESYPAKQKAKKFCVEVKSVRYGVVGNISACHADARGSIPRFGVYFFCVIQIFFVFAFNIFYDETLSTLCPSG